MLLDAWQAAPPGSGALRIAGDGPLRREVEDRAKAGHNVQYLGILRPEQVSDEVTCACAVVVPSLWHETFGMGVIDAFDTGVRSSRPAWGISERSWTTASATIASTTEGLAEAIIQARIPEIAQPKGASARRRYESDYSPDRACCWIGERLPRGGSGAVEVLNRRGLRGLPLAVRGDHEADGRTPRARHQRCDRRDRSAHAHRHVVIELRGVVRQRDRVRDAPFGVRPCAIVICERDAEPHPPKRRRRRERCPQRR